MEITRKQPLQLNKHFVCCMVDQLYIQEDELSSSCEWIVFFPDTQLSGKSQISYLMDSLMFGRGEWFSASDSDRFGACTLSRKGWTHACYLSPVRTQTKRISTPFLVRAPAVWARQTTLACCGCWVRSYAAHIPTVSTNLSIVILLPSFLSPAFLLYLSWPSNLLLNSFVYLVILFCWNLLLIHLLEFYHYFYHYCLFTYLTYYH